MPDVCAATEPGAGQRRWGHLVAGLALMAVVWGVVLPRLADWPAVQARVERNQRLEIDPSATFYTDQPALSSAVVTLQSAQRREPKSWWFPGEAKRR